MGGQGLESHFSINKFVVYHGYLNEKVGLVQLCKLPFSSVASKHRSLAGPKAVSSLQALLRVKNGKRPLSKGTLVSRLLTPGVAITRAQSKKI